MWTHCYPSAFWTHLVFAVDGTGIQAARVLLCCSRYRTIAVVIRALIVRSFSAAWILIRRYRETGSLIMYAVPGCSSFLLFCLFDIIVRAIIYPIGSLGQGEFDAMQH